MCVCAKYVFVRIEYYCIYLYKLITKLKINFGDFYIIALQTPPLSGGGG